MMVLLICLGDLNGLDGQRFLAWLADRYTVRECSLYPRYNFISVSKSSRN